MSTLRSKLFALVAVVGMVGMALGPAAAAASTSGNTAVNDSLSDSVNTDQNVVKVTKNDSSVETATVDVASDGTYSGTGTYSTNEYGAVSLDAPEGNVTIDVTATTDGETATTTATLTVEDEADTGK